MENEGQGTVEEAEAEQTSIGISQDARDLLPPDVAAHQMRGISTEGRPPDETPLIPTYRMAIAAADSMTADVVLLLVVLGRHRE